MSREMFNYNLFSRWQKQKKKKMRRLSQIIYDHFRAHFFIKSFFCVYCEWDAKKMLQNFAQVKENVEMVF